MTRLPLPHTDEFRSCRFKRDTLSYRLRRKVRDVTRRLAPRFGSRPRIVWDDWIG